jgi:mitochondrial import inner membrane translocase subunit TIM54
MTIYLAAPPGDGLRTAREHFHTYVKPVLVAAAMDWDVVEGRKEGDVRYKTAERIRRKRKRNGEGKPLTEEELADMFLVDSLRERVGTREFDGVAGDLVIGRNTWKEYIRGMHEGWLGPVDSPKLPEADGASGDETTTHVSGQSSLGGAAAKAAVNAMVPSTSNPDSASEKSEDARPVDDASPTAESSESKSEEQEEEEKPKPRQPPPYIDPTEYPSATPSSSITDLIGPSIGVRHPHILGFRNTPIRIYRFLTRRHLADSIGRDVAAAVLAAHRPYSTVAATSDESGAADIPEQKAVLQHEERDWWKTTFNPRKEHEESVWIEDIILDERITNRMRAFQLTAEDEDRAKRIADGREVVKKREEIEE